MSKTLQWSCLKEKEEEEEEKGKEKESKWISSIQELVF